MDNVRQNWQLFSAALSEDIVDNIVKQAGETAEACTFNSSGADIRKSKVSWLTNNKPVLDLLYDFVDIANRNAFNDEYKGGAFSFSECTSPDPVISKQKGTVLVFPSYLQHSVQPVTSGTRRSLVAWFEGPKWV
jgi:hypothetical protein